MVIINMRTSIALVLTIATLLIYTSVQAATITVSADRNPVELNESFSLIFESDSSVDSEPDFSPLNKDFQILSRNSNDSMSFVNGKISRSKKWQLTALARRAGKLIIPAIQFGKDISQPSFITVTNGSGKSSSASSSQDVFIEVDVTSKNPYVQAEVIYTVRLFLAVATSNASLSEPGISGASAVIERLGEDSNFQTNRRGKRYNVVERRYAIYPQISGDMTIEPIMFQGQINRRGFSLFNDPFGSQASTTIERSAPITLEVKPVPDQFPGGHWIPAKQLTIGESWSDDPPRFQVGEPLTRTLTLVAQGQTASQLLELPEWVPEAFKKYPDQPTLSDGKDSMGITATRQEKVAIIPNRAGDYVLPEISVPWWNTVTNELEYARIPERKITVAGIPEALQPRMPALPGMDDINIIPDENGGGLSEPSVLSEANQDTSVRFWQRLSAGLALAWMCTLFLWWRNQTARKKEAVQDNKTNRLKESIKAVELACQEGEPDKLKQALLFWGHQAWSEAPPTSLGEIGRRCPVELGDKINELNSSLYSQQKSRFNVDSFWQVFKNNHGVSVEKQDGQKGELEPLYRL